MSPLPSYLKKPIYCGKNLFRVEKILQTLGLETVCQEAHCPNLGECWSQGTATFLILGKYCTRNCRFCAVEKGAPLALDPEEPKKIAKAVRELGLKYVVVTSVTRDDLPDAGASHFAKVIREILWAASGETSLPPEARLAPLSGVSFRRENPQTKIEVLIPDFQGSPEALKIVVDARPDVLAHNLETVPRLYSRVRPEANYRRSLGVLAMAKIMNPHIPTKSGLMLGLGETKKEILKVLRDLRQVDCDFLTLGQYLAPSKNHLPVERFVLPKEFEKFQEISLGLGFKKVASAPLVRSSYRAREMLDNAKS